MDGHMGLSEDGKQDNVGQENPQTESPGFHGHTKQVKHVCIICRCSGGLFPPDGLVRIGNNLVITRDLSNRTDQILNPWALCPPPPRGELPNPTSLGTTHEASYQGVLSNNKLAGNQSTGQGAARTLRSKQPITVAHLFRSWLSIFNIDLSSLAALGI